MSQGITVSINADSAAAEQRVVEFFKRFTEGANQLSGVSEFFSDLKGKILAAFTVGAITEFVGEIINGAEALKSLNTETGVSLQLLSALKEKANATRLGFAGVAQELGQFSNRLGLAIRQGGEAARPFRDLIGVEGLAGFASGAKTTDEVLLQVVDAFNKMEEGPRKTALSMEVFGRSGREMLVLLQQLKSGAGEGVFSPEMVKQSEEFNTKIREMKSQLERIGVSLAADLLPSLKVLVEELRSLNSESGSAATIVSTLGDVLKGVVVFAIVQIEYAKKGIEDFADLIETVADALVSLWGDIKTTITALLDLAGVGNAAGLVLGKALRGDAVGALQAFKDLTKSVADDLKNIVAAINDATTGPMDRASAYAERSAKRAAETATRVAKILGDLYGKPEPAPGVTGKEKSSKSSGDQEPPLSVAGQQLADEIDKAFLEQTQGKIAALHAELDQQLLKAFETIGPDNMNRMEEERFKIMQIFAQKETDLLKQQSQAEMEIELAKVQGKRKILEGDPTQTDVEKKKQLLALLGQEHDLLAKNIAVESSRVGDMTLTPEARLLASKQLQELRQKLAENEQDTGKTSRKGTFFGTLTEDYTAFINQLGTFQSNLASLVISPFKGMFDGLKSSITGLINETMTWGEALRNIATSVAQSVVQAFSNMAASFITDLVTMAAKWVATHVFMAGVSKVFHAIETADTLANVEARVAAQEMGEAQQTAATGGGSIARGLLRVGETVFHGIQVGLRVAAHFGAEILMTAVSLAQSAIRIGVILAEAVVWLIQAAFKGASSVADVPYVGPILAVLAMGAIIAAGVEAMGGFQSGGYTGDGPHDGVAGRVHYGEFVMSAPAVTRLGADNLKDLHTGNASIVRRGAASSLPGGIGGSPGSPGGVTSVVNLSFHDTERSARQYLSTQNGENHVIDIVNRNRHRIG
jgi:hypothetical protein